jgi:hypothetical protein
VSFGGRDNNELAVSCQSTAALTAAYLAPVSRYHLSVIDLDIEGAALTNAAANRRRALAIAAAQHIEVAHGRRLGVWLTLPVSATGLTPTGISALRAMLAAHVELSGVNALAMDFARIDEFFARRTTSLTTLVPSYQEEEDVIRMTLLSAALQEYPDQRIVLLIDDPPDPRYAQPYQQLHAARALPDQVQALLAEPRARFDQALEHWEPVLDCDRGRSRS